MKKCKSVNQFAKAENDDNDALKLRSIKNSKSLLECLRSLRVLLPSMQKVQWHGIVEIVLGWREQDY